MSIIYTDAIDRTIADEMNDGAFALGPSDKDVITQGECEDLAEFMELGSDTVMRWFGLSTPRRRIVPIGKDPNDPNSVHAIGRRIISMYPSDDDNEERANAIDQLRYRCFIAACAGVDGGLERDPKFHGTVRSFLVKFPPITLSSASKVIQGIIDGVYGENAQFIAKAWFRLEILRRVGGWNIRVTIRQVAPGQDYPKKGQG